MTDSLPLLFAAAFILVGFFAVAGFFVFLAVRTLGRVSKHGGVAGALYGGRVTQTYGEIDAASRGFASVRLKVVGVEAQRPAVGIELHVNAKLGYSMRAVRLTPEEAVRVASALEAAVP